MLMSFDDARRRKPRQGAGELISVSLVPIPKKQSRETEADPVSLLFCDQSVVYASAARSAASTTCFIKTVVVTLPTPPGTGV